MGRRGIRGGGTVEATRGKSTSEPLRPFLHQSSASHERWRYNRFRLLLLHTRTVDSSRTHLFLSYHQHSSCPLISLLRLVILPSLLSFLPPSPRTGTLPTTLLTTLLLCYSHYSRGTTEHVRQAGVDNRKHRREQKGRTSGDSSTESQRKGRLEVGEGWKTGVELVFGPRLLWTRAKGWVELSDTISAGFGN